MAYQRKTIDTWRILVNYGQGWEHDCTEMTFRDARTNLQAYRENCPEYPAKIKYAREPIEA